MIAQLTGKLIHKTPQYLVIDVGGVGYRVTVSLTSFSQMPAPGEPVTLYTHTHLREDGISLFGFTSLEEKNIFQKLISISGVGPKIALTILSGLPAGELADAIGGEDAVKLQSIPGVGKKTAERIIIELKDKITRGHPAAENTQAASGARRLYDDVLSALENLGYQKPVAEKAMRSVNWNEVSTIEAAIRATLKGLASS